MLVLLTALVRMQGFVCIHCVPQKTCDYIFYNNFNNRCPITIFFGIVIVYIVSLCVIERWFHFPPHLSSATIPSTFCDAGVTSQMYGFQPRTSTVEIETRVNFCENSTATFRHLTYYTGWAKLSDTTLHFCL